MNVIAASQQRAKAAILAVIAVGLASMQDAVVKGVSSSLPAYETVIYRILVSLPLFYLWHWFSGERASLFPANLNLVLLRSGILCVAYFAFVLSIAQLPIATSVSIYFTMPFFVAALAGWSLGESVRAYRWIAIAVGFTGVLVMVRPGAEAFEPAALLALLSAFGYAVGQLIGRHVSQVTPPLVIAVWQTLVYLVVAIVIGLIAPLFADRIGESKVLGFLLRPWVWPDLLTLGLLFGMGLLGTAASMLFINAYRHAEANYVAPFEYTALLWAILYGIVFFGDFPDGFTLAGAAIVIAAGLWMLRQDFTRQQP